MSNEQQPQDSQEQDVAQQNAEQQQEQQAQAETELLTPEQQRIEVRSGE